MKKVILLILLCVLPSLAVAGEYYYVNSYFIDNVGITHNAVYRIDIENKRIVDSLLLDISGEFINKFPISLNYEGQSLLATFIINGLASKNTSLGGPITSMYAIIDKVRFQKLRQDSMPFIFIYPNLSVERDSIFLNWTDYSPHSSGCSHGSFILDSSNYSLRIGQQVPYRDDFDRPIIIGEFLSPSILTINREFKYYWDLDDRQEASLFKTDYNNNILSQITVGDKNSSSILVGYNPIDSLIYVFKQKYYLETYTPPISSPDSVINVVEIIRPSDFSIINNFRLPDNPYIIADEVSNAEFINGCFVYYYSQSEDYRSFQPASIFIFDTRTNEATWLRVGWR